MNPLIQGHSETTPEMSWNAFSTNQGTNEDDSQSDPHPEAGLFNNQMTQNSGQKDCPDNCQKTEVGIVVRTAKFPFGGFVISAQNDG